MNQRQFLVNLSLLPIILFLPFPALAQTINVDVKDLIPTAAVFFSPSAQTVLEGSTFEVAVFLNTRGGSVNTIDININFPSDKLAIVRPSAGKSLIRVWLEPPFYSNTDGLAQYVGIIPDGVTTTSGLITTITFKALMPGEANVKISSKSKILANDGLGTEVETEFGRAKYTIIPKPPDGVKVFSETHPFESQYYNNNNPIISWEKGPGVTDFAFVLDNKPFTVPSDTAKTQDTTVGYNRLVDGLHYFHIKAYKLGIWGPSSHFLVRIDTTPPAGFSPKVEFLSTELIRRSLVSFFTTDTLSGLDHYEVGIIDKYKSPNLSPIFVQAESPYQLPDSISDNIRIIVRAFDKAGNVRDESINTRVLAGLTVFLKNSILYILLIALGLVFLALILHYVFGHNIITHLKHIARFIKKEGRHTEQKK